MFRFINNKNRNLLEEEIFQKRLMKIEEQGQRNLRRRQLEEKRDSFKPQRKKIQTSKLLTGFLMAFILINCVAVEIFSMYAMICLKDISSIYALIAGAVTSVIGEITALAVYSFKSMKENCSGGITFETAMSEMKRKLDNENDKNDNNDNSDDCIVDDSDGIVNESITNITDNTEKIDITSGFITSDESGETDDNNM